MQSRTVIGLVSVLLASVAALVPAEAAGGASGCKGNPGLVGRCYWVRGTVSLSADRGIVIGRDDHRPALVIGNAPGTQRDMPTSMYKALDRAHRDTGFISAWVHGDFEVCPIPPDVPELDYACVNSAAHLTTEKKGER